MHKIKNGRLDRKSINTLAELQLLINLEQDYIDQVRKAQSQWANKRKEPVFQAVTAKLVEMNPSHGSCYYCCGSEAGSIDHFQPKSLFPQLTFAWSNFVHTCERCNTRHKRERCAVIVAEQILDIGQYSGGPIPRYPKSRIALINPRREDPLRFLRLDVGPNGTFEFEPVRTTGTVEKLRAEYTCELLGLNRPYLIKERRQAYEGIVRYLHAYHDAKLTGNRTKMSRMRRNIRRVSHQAVWQELIRSFGRIAEIAEVGRACPELLKPHI